MIRSKGKYFSEQELNRILMLLRDTNMTLRELADRMHCSRSAVAAINAKFQIRVYGGKRSEWSVNCVRQSEGDQVLDSNSVVLSSHRDWPL